VVVLFGLLGLRTTQHPPPLASARNSIRPKDAMSLSTIDKISESVGRRSIWLAPISRSIFCRVEHGIEEVVLRDHLKQVPDKRGFGSMPDLPNCPRT
jgi:hypothetical protein